MAFSCGGHFLRYINVESLRCTPETNMILYAITKKDLSKSLWYFTLKGRIPNLI